MAVFGTDKDTGNFGRTGEVIPRRETWFELIRLLKERLLDRTGSQSGGSLSFKYLLGHQSASTTDIYLQSLSDRVKEAAKDIESPTKSTHSKKMSGKA